MDNDELDRLSVNYPFILNDENSRRLTDVLGRARLNTNKEEAIHLRTKADTLVFRELLSQVDNVAAFTRLSRNKSNCDGWVCLIRRVITCAKNSNPVSKNRNIRGTNIRCRFLGHDGPTVTP